MHAPHMLLAGTDQAVAITMQCCIVIKHHTYCDTVPRASMLPWQQQLRSDEAKPSALAYGTDSLGMNASSDACVYSSTRFAAQQAM